MLFRSYLHDILRRLPSHPNKDIWQLTPRGWKETFAPKTPSPGPSGWSLPTLNSAGSLDQINFTSRRAPHTASPDGYVVEAEDSVPSPLLLLVVRPLICGCASPSSFRHTTIDLKTTRLI